MAAPVIPVGVNMATIAWLWTATIGDETTVPSGLTVTFDPAPEWLQYTAATPHMTIAPWSVTGTIDTTDGTLLGPDGTANVTLLPTDDTNLNPSAWTYQVTVRQGSLVLMDFPIAAPGGVTTDLSDVVPIAGSTGNAVVTGPPTIPGAPVATAADLLDGISVGEAHMTLDTGHLWIWTGVAWSDGGMWRGPVGDVTPDALSAKAAALSAAATAVAAAASLGSPAAVGLTHTGVAWYEYGAVAPDTYAAVDATGTDTALLSGSTGYIRQTTGTPMMPAVQSRMRRCVVADDGSGVIYYLDCDDSTLIAGTWDGSKQGGWVRVYEGVLDPDLTTPGQTPTANAALRTGVLGYDPRAYYRRGDRVLHGDRLWDSLADQIGVEPQVGSVSADLTGGAGQVMVEIPAFYYRMDYEPATHRHCWEVAFDTDAYRLFPDLSTPSDLLDRVTVAGRTFQLHPWFIKAGIQRAARYRSAFHAVAENTGNNSTGKLLSIADGASTNTTNVSNTNFRAKARNRNSGLTDLSGAANNVWSMGDYWAWHAILLLLFTEYRTMYSQSVIGGGNHTGNVYNKITGRTAACGNGSAVTDSSGTRLTPTIGSTDAVTYRGIEDFWGTAWQWCDGWNIRNGSSGQEHWVSRAPANWAWSTTSGYDLIGITPTGTDSWQYPRGFLSGSWLGNVFGGNTGSYLTDGQYANNLTDNSWRVALIGGSAARGAPAGAGALTAYYGPGSADVSSGAALQL